MEPKWTEEQLAVINHRDDNMLVSAAAGSGKTAVLIERVMGRLLDET
ncbi:MAG: UvrD-helicase domain-containing protein, partial [Catonella sp.]